MKRTCVLAAMLVVSSAHAQLVNPSFETPGAGGQPFAAWTTFGPVGASNALVSDGARAARAVAPGSGTWAVAGMYQDIAVTPGQWVRASVRAGHTGADGLVGETRGIANIEWRDGADNLISYESLAVAMSADSPDTMCGFTRLVGPAPAGTAAARLLLGTFETPAQNPGAVCFDEAALDVVAAPTDADIQWNDFGERTIEWSGYTWRIKRGGPFGPGGYLFSDSPDAAWTDDNGRLHLRVTERDGQWYSVELVLDEALGFGEYLFRSVGRIDQLDPNLVLAMFLWEYKLDYTGIETSNVANEFDIEISRWKNSSAPPAQFVCQPWSNAGNLRRYAMTIPGASSIATHSFAWSLSRVACRSWLGETGFPHAGDMFEDWVYTGSDVPRPESPRVHFNLWLNEEPPGDGLEHEVVIDSFEYLPGCGEDIDGDGGVTIDDLHALHQNPVDINGDGAADGEDIWCLERFLRRREREDMNR